MNIVFTGSTSFTGLWFIKALQDLGHRVFALVQKKREDYEGLRKTRLDLIQEPLFDVPFGSEAFYYALNQIDKIDVFCHHAADVTNYKSPDFDPVNALSKNTFNARKTLELLKSKNCKSFVLTGSVFEPGEGKGTDNLRAVSPYGLSKGLTSSYFQYFVPNYGIKFKKFVIPNPFGPYEEVRFTTFLAKEWLKNETPPITMPSYVRDNIPVTLLAESYAKFVESDLAHFNPSYKPESTANFVERFSQNLKPFLNRPCHFKIVEQKDFSEPLERINTDPIKCLNFDEKAFYQSLAQFYLNTYG